MCSSDLEQYESQIAEYIKLAVKNDLVDSQTATNITPKNSRTATFYMLPKIHKNNVPGRPIVSAIGSPTEIISKYVDSHLIPLVKKIDSYIKDTSDVIKKIRNLGNVPENSILGTIDVSALYTNIPHSEGKQACKQALDTREDQKIPTEFITRLMDFILKCNCFEFNNRHYRQVQGTAMGTCMAPSYANLFMAHLEQNFLNTQEIKPLIWWRFIDDIFFIWTHGEENLNSFLTELNEFHNTIKFTQESSRSSIPFLDIRIHLDKGKLWTTTYHKPTDRSTYLHYKSCHPTSQKKSIPYSQMVRMVRNNTKSEDAQHHIEELTKKFLDRGYPASLINQAKEQALNLTQEETLTPKQRSQQNNLVYVSTYNPFVRNLKDIITRDMRILSLHKETAHITKESVLVAYRRQPNLGDLLTSSQLAKKPIQSGTFKCGKCSNCKFINTEKSFQNRTTGQTYKTRGHIDCNSHNVIYVITCKKCRKQYVGQTSLPLKLRMSNHISSIKKKDFNKPTTSHFNQPDHTWQDVTFQGIMTSSHDVTGRLTWERTWIRLLNTFEPHGINRKE